MGKEPGAPRQGHEPTAVRYSAARLESSVQARQMCLAAMDPAPRHASEGRAQGMEQHPGDVCGTRAEERADASQPVRHREMTGEENEEDKANSGDTASSRSADEDDSEETEDEESKM